MTSQRIALFASVALVFAACTDTGTRQSHGGITVSITSPGSESIVTAGTAVAFKANAASDDGIANIRLLVGERELRACPGAPDPELSCGVEFDPASVADQVDHGMLKLTAGATDPNGNQGSKSIVVYLQGSTDGPDAGEPDAGTGPTDGLRFVQPAPGADGSATVTGQSPLELAVTTTHVITRIDVTFDDGKALRTFTSAPYQSSVDWAREMGTGQHRLTAKATDDAGGVLEASMIVRSPCSKDADCGAGTRCCAEKGTCHAIVAPGADCDCEHPCPDNQGCFPGTCGQTPRRCRPGCFPGDDTRRADRCANQDGRIAYCSKLPEAEKTAQNQGGACAPADVCDVILQNCPDLPLDRTRPAGPDNPLVPHNCVPVSPVANACIPAGAIGLNQSGCGSDKCGMEGLRTGCVKGGLCVTPLGPDLQPIGPAYCAKQCLRTGTSQCPSPQRCGGLVGAGYEPYPTGACSGG